jgi:hypothetical protein
MKRKEGGIMLLCLGMIEDGLGKDILYKNYINTDNPFVLERCEAYRGGGIFNACVLYLARAEELPETFSAQEGAALACIGMPPEAYRRSAMHAIAYDESTELLSLVNEVGRIFFEFNTLEQRLQDSVNKGRSIQYMVEQMAPYFNENELLVCNSDFRMTGQSNKTIHLNEISGLGQPDEDGMLPPDIVTFFKNDVIFAEIRDLREPFVYESSIFLCRAIDMNVFRRGEYACRVIIAEDRNTFRGYEAGLLRFFTGFIQLVYDLSAESSGILPGDHLTDIFIDLLSGSSVEEYRFEKSFFRRGWQKPGPFVCARIMPSDRDYYNRTITYYCRVFNRDIGGCCFFEYEGAIVCVVNLDQYGGAVEEFIAKNIETFRDGNFRVGYSNTFKGIAELRNYYFQAKAALRIGISQAPSIWCHRFSSNALEYIRAKLTEDIDGRYLCAPEILVLDEYDRENGTGLLQTLRLYVDNGMNAIKTAGDLYIHRSTMVYRLERIRELTGIDFKDPARVLYLAISLRLLFKE